MENRGKKWKIMVRYFSAIKLFGFYFAYLDGVLKGLNAMIISYSAIIQIMELHIDYRAP